MWHGGSASGRGMLCHGGGCGSHVAVVMWQSSSASSHVMVVMWHGISGGGYVIVVMWQAVVAHCGTLLSHCIMLWWQQ